jgi:hypothetical protein
MVKALLAMMLLCVAVAARRDTETQGGFEQAMPPHAAVITLGRPSAWWEPTTSTGVGQHWQANGRVMKAQRR